jgi:hypothetical protein
MPSNSPQQPTSSEASIRETKALARGSRLSGREVGSTSAKDPMMEDIARSILRLIAVVTVLAGASLTTATLVSLLGASSSMHGAPEGVQVKLTGMVAEMGGYAVLSHAMIAACGVALYVLSPWLAQKVVE